jgi:glycine cleavage system H protein
MTKVPDDLHYTKDHEWVRVEGKKATIGITDHAQHELTDIVFVELPKLGKVLKAHEKLGVVESVKSASEIYAPVSGKVIEVNDTLQDSPEAVNKDPYGRGWVATVEVSDLDEVKGLLNAAGYKKHIGE